jgi:hypothetical protein
VAHGKETTVNLVFGSLRPKGQSEENVLLIVLEFIVHQEVPELFSQ